jgi:hypothetical protein
MPVRPNIVTISLPRLSAVLYFLIWRVRPRRGTWMATSQRFQLQVNAQRVN